jgi:hypothetical protein
MHLHMHAGPSNWPKNRGVSPSWHGPLISTQKKIFLVDFELALLYKGNRPFFISTFSFYVVLRFLWWQLNAFWQFDFKVSVEIQTRLFGFFWKSKNFFNAIQTDAKLLEILQKKLFVLIWTCVYRKVNYSYRRRWQRIDGTLFEWLNDTVM